MGLVAPISCHTKCDSGLLDQNQNFLIQPGLCLAIHATDVCVCCFGSSCVCPIPRPRANVIYQWTRGYILIAGFRPSRDRFAQIDDSTAPVMAPNRQYEEWHSLFQIYAQILCSCNLDYQIYWRQSIALQILTTAEQESYFARFWGFSINEIITRVSILLDNFRTNITQLSSEQPKCQ